MRAYGRHGAHNQTIPSFSWTLAYKIPSSHILVLEMGTMHRPENLRFSMIFLLRLVEMDKANWELTVARWQEPGTWTTTWSSYSNKISVGLLDVVLLWYQQLSGISIKSNCVTFLLISLSLSSRSTLLLPFCFVFGPLMFQLVFLLHYPFLFPSLSCHSYYFPSWINPHTPCHSDLSFHAWLWALPMTYPTECGSWSLGPNSNYFKDYF